MLQKKLNAVIALLKLYDIIFVCMCAKLSKFYFIYLKIFFMLGIVYVHVCVGVYVHMFVCVYVCACTCHSTHEDIREQLYEVVSYFPLLYGL